MAGWSGCPCAQHLQTLTLTPHPCHAQTACMSRMCSCQGHRQDSMDRQLAADRQSKASLRSKADQRASWLPSLFDTVIINCSSRKRMCNTLELQARGGRTSMSRSLCSWGSRLSGGSSCPQAAPRSPAHRRLAPHTPPHSVHFTLHGAAAALRASLTLCVMPGCVNATGARPRWSEAGQALPAACEACGPRSHTAPVPLNPAGFRDAAPRRSC